MVLRELERRPLRRAALVLGIALAVAVLVAGRFASTRSTGTCTCSSRWPSATTSTVTFRAAGRSALAARARAPAGRAVKAEGLRAVSVRFRNGHKARETIIAGYPETSSCGACSTAMRTCCTVPDERHPADRDPRARSSASRSAIRSRSSCSAASRARTACAWRAWSTKCIGLFGHMRADVLAKMLGDEELVSIALLRVDPKYEGALQRALRERPDVLGVNRHSRDDRDVREADRAVRCATRR